MPFLTIKTNVKVDEEKSTKIKSSLGQSINLIPGKSENWLFIDIQDEANLYFRGKNDKPILFVNAVIFNNESHSGYEEFSDEATKLFNSVLDIPLDNIIINYADAKSFSLGGDLYSIVS